MFVYIYIAKTPTYNPKINQYKLEKRPYSAKNNLRGQAFNQELKGLGGKIGQEENQTVCVYDVRNNYLIIKKKEAALLLGGNLLQATVGEPRFDTNGPA